MWFWVFFLSSSENTVAVITIAYREKYYKGVSKYFLHCARTGPEPVQAYNLEVTDNVTQYTF